MYRSVSTPLEQTLLPAPDGMPCLALVPQGYYDSISVTRVPRGQRSVCMCGRTCVRVCAHASVSVCACPLSAPFWLCVFKESQISNAPVCLIAPLWPNVAAALQYGVPSLIILPTDSHCLMISKREIQRVKTSLLEIYCKHEK